MIVVKVDKVDKETTAAYSCNPVVNALLSAVDCSEKKNKLPPESKSIELFQFDQSSVN